MSTVEQVSPPPGKLLISRSQAARRLGMSVDMVDRLIDGGHIRRLDLPGGSQKNVISASVESFAQSLQRP